MTGSAGPDQAKSAGDPSGAPGAGDPDVRHATGGTGAPTGAGFGRLLVAVYGILALSATARAAYQLIAQGSEAPLAYSLSLLAGVVYIVATVALWHGGTWRRVAWVACTVELVGVLAVGAASLADSDAFPDSTVWSDFGSGYGYIPLVLPFVGLWWLWHTRPATGGIA